MILAVAAGNTHVTFGCIDENNEIGEIMRISTQLSETALGYAVRFREIFQFLNVDPKSIEGAVLSSVVPPLGQALREAVFRLTGKDPLVVGAGVKTGLRMKVDDPGTVGADLVCAAVAAKEEYPLPCVVVDMGTATTLTVVDREGSYIGGAILPGAVLSLDALTRGASLLPQIDLVRPAKAVSSSTVECMRSGILYGSAGAVDGLLERFEEELKERVFVVATGEIAPSIAPYCRHSVHFDDRLILKGLGIIYRKNQKRS